MGYAVIFGILAAHPAVVEYRGPTDHFDPGYAHVISFTKAEQLINARRPVYFWPPKRQVMLASKKEALDLLHDWMKGKPTKIPKRTQRYRSKLGVIVE